MPFALLLALTLVSACDVGSESGASGGAPSDAPGTFATVAPEPVLSIGGQDAEGPEQFYRVQNILIDAEDRLWVADGQSGEIRIFTPDGSHVRTVGGAGEGPGEFLTLRLLGTAPGDSVVAGDPRTDRLTIFDPAGEFVRTEPVPTVGDAVPMPSQVFAEDGSVLALVPLMLEAGDLEVGEVLGAPLQLVRIGRTSGRSTPYAEIPAASFVWTGASQVPVPFRLNAPYAVTGGSVLTSSGPEFRISVFEGGELSEEFGVDRPRRPVDDAAIRAYRSFVETYVPEEARAEHLEVLDHEARPEWLPAYDRILVSQDGFVWAEIYEVDPVAPHTWDVYDPDRQFVGQVDAPAGLQVMAVTGDRLIGVWRDELETEHVRVYELAAPTGEARSSAGP